MEKKMTAVQWLRQKFHTVPPSEFGNLFEQALALEREQIEGANLRGFYCGIDLSNGVSLDFKSASEYYTQTYQPVTH